MISTDQVQESFARCNLKDYFIDRFYENFLASNDVFAEMFASTDFSKQKELLRRGISMMILFADGNPVGRIAIERLGLSHGQGKMALPRDIYNYWIDSLIKTLSETDSQWSPGLEKQWRDTMTSGIDHMARRGGMM